jgi:hypothetical protein
MGRIDRPKVFSDRPRRNAIAAKEGPMAFDESLAGRIRGILARRKGVEEKRMFGGVGFLLSGNMCVGVWKDSLIARLGVEQGEEAMRQPHVKAFDITGKAMKGWVLVGPEGVADDRLNDWVRLAVSFVGQLPRK